MSDPDRDVFLSYRHREPTQTWVRDILAPALQADFSVILDANDFRPGITPVDDMERSSERARLTVAVVDDAYDESWFTRFEAAISGALLVVQRGDIETVPAATQTIVMRNDDPTPVVDLVDRMIKRVFVLESEADEAWVRGYLLPALRHEHIDVRDVGELLGAGDTPAGQPVFETIDRALEWADKVVVVVSRAYVHDLGPTRASLVKEYELENRSDKIVPIMLEKPSSPDDAYQVPPMYRALHPIDMADNRLWDEALRRICALLDVPPPRPRKAPPCPYPGMRPFREDGLYPFVGRDAEIRLVMEQLRRSRRTAIVFGPSGSGKSSLVLAGVIPQIIDEQLDHRPQCAYEVVTPSQDPTEAIVALAPGLHPGRSRLLVVDQMEQAFTNPATRPGSTSGDDASPAGLQRHEVHSGFLEMLADLRSTDPDLHLVGTIRADFYGQLMLSPIWQAVKFDMVPITPLAGEDLRRAIREPAEALGVVIDEALVANLAAETEGEPGLMPFLQETLRKLWGREPWWYLSLSDHEWASGEFGVRNAIRQQANEAIKKIRDAHGEADGDRIVRSILLRLVNFVEGGRHTRHQVAVSKLVDAAPDPVASADVLRILSDEEQRLVTVDTRTIEDDDGEHHVQTAELSHEAIIDGFPEFRQWIDQHDGVEIERRSWTMRLGGELLTGRDLQAAERWLSTAAEIDFLVEPELVRYITQSRTQQDERDEAARLQQEAASLAEAEAEERRRRRLLRFLSAAVVIAVALGGLAVYAFNARGAAQRAQRNAEIETDRRVSTQLQTSASAFDNGLASQALLVRAADIIDENDLGVIEMLATAERDPGIGRRIDATTRNVGFEAAVVLADGRVVIGDGVGAVTFWEPDSFEPVETIDVGHGVLSMASRPGDPWIAIGGGNSSGATFDGSDGWVDLVDTSVSPPAERRITLDTDAPVSTMVFDGDELIAGTWDGNIAVIDVSNPNNAAVERVVRAPDPPTASDCVIDESDRSVRSLAIDEQRRWLVAGINNCVIAVWDRASLELTDRLVAHTSKVRSVTFVPGTTQLLSTGDDATIRSWQLDGDRTAITLVPSANDNDNDPTEPRVGTPPRGGLVLDGRVITMCALPNGNGVVTAGRDHVVRLWTVDGGEVVDVAEFATHTTTVRSVACPTDTTFTSLAADGFVVWDLDRPNRWARPILTTEPTTDTALPSRSFIATRPGDADQIALVVGGELRVVAADGSTRALVGTERTDGFTAIEYSPDGRTLVAVAEGASGWPDEIVIFDADTGVPANTSPSSGAGELNSLAVVDEDTYAAGMNADQILLLRDGVETTIDNPSGHRVTALALTDSHLVVGDDAGTLLCAALDPEIGPDIATDIEFESTELGRRINEIAVTPADESGGRSLALGTADGQILAYAGALDDDTAECDPRTWGTTSPRVVHDSIDAVALDETGEVLLAATSGGGVEIWDLPRVRLVGTLTLSANEPATSVDIDREAIVVGGLQSALRFDIDRAGLRTRLCEIAARNLTPDEEASFLPAPRYRDAAKCFG